MENFEKLGYFYLGQEQTGDGREGAPLLMYPSSHLTTHGFCVGMTGSGKTGLCIDLLEEAAIDEIPALIIDPKGDMGNLCLSFPELSPADFRPWVNADQARSEGLSVEEKAGALAAQWRQGLEASGQSGERIRLLREKADITIFTPGSNSGEPLSILSLLSAPPEATREDIEVMSDLVQGAASGLLGLLGQEADPLNSREHILIANILMKLWQEGKDVTLADLIGLMIKPPFDRLGVLDLNSFYPEKERTALAMSFNRLLASPGFAQWLVGQPLDVESLLYTREGKPRLVILSIAHLSESERMFFVTLLLNQVLAWMRRQSGSESLHAILYMDEIYGYFPPVKNPPSKEALLRLLKQGRAYGLGVLLCTQNSMDLDYKGLANIGSWFIGRLQTENDRRRLIEGLQGAALSSGETLSASELEGVLSGLDKRCFLLHDVHAAHSVVFKTRHCLSYLKGPMSRADIVQLKELGLSDPLVPVRKLSLGSVADSGPAADAGFPVLSSQETAARLNPVTTFKAGQSVEGSFHAGEAISPAASALSPTTQDAGNAQMILAGLPTELSSFVLPAKGTGRFVPMLGALTEIAYKEDDKSMTVEREFRVTEISNGILPVDWSRSEVLDLSPEHLSQNFPAGAQLQAPPQAAYDKANLKTWSNQLQDYLYQHASLSRYSSPDYKCSSEAGESERDFRIRLQRETREQRDAELAKLESRYQKRLASLEEKVRKAEQTVAREESQAVDSKRQAAISVGATILSAVMGRKMLSSTTFNRATTASRAASRANRDSHDIGRAEETLEVRRQELEALQEEMADELQKLGDQLEARANRIEEKKLKPLKRDIQIRLFGLFWEQR